MPPGGGKGSVGDQVDREDGEGLYGCGTTESTSGWFSW